LAWCLADGAAECVADAVGDGEAAALIGERQRESIALAIRFETGIGTAPR